ncbi:spermine synthase [Desulfonatronospira sp. MSAO_Bac3]|uniref:spermine/spermidine synthase domain-containing protein n=1 Tax=Desulfonatronospira sp. MSAO_Bac3 TaxID=2293857 RepID=UPI00257D3839|nr:spermine synthase [Desulfonatronospira sp. MSAO_Bac3]
MKQRIPYHLISVLMLGVISQIGQVLLLRELLMVFHGNELSIGIILSAWLAWVGLGSRLGARVVDRWGRPVFLLKTTAAAVLLLLPLTILTIRTLRGFFDVLPGAYLTLPEMLVSCFIVTAPVCLLTGSQFVLLSRVWRERDKSLDTTGAGKTYVGEATGNMLGGILFSFVLVHLLNPFQTSMLVAALMLAAVMLIVPARPSLRPRALAAVPVVLAAAVLLFFSLDHLDRFAHQIQWKQAAPQHQLVDTQESKHGNIAVLKRQDQYSFFQSGHLVFSTAGPETLVPGLEGQEAVSFAHLAMVQHQDPERVLLIGGGLRGTLAEILKHPVGKIDYIELDEKLVQTAAAHVHPGSLEVLDDPRVNLMHTDARLFVKRAGQEYDMIIVDSPDPTTAAMNRFYTREFFEEARKSLNPQGVLVAGTASTPDLRGTAIANRNTAVFHTLDRVFSHTLVAGDRFMFYFASDDPEQISVDPARLQERYTQRGIEAQGFSPVHYQVLLEESQLRRVNWVVRHHGRSPESHLEGPPSVPVSPGPVKQQARAQKDLDPVQDRYFLNTDFRPITYFYTLMHISDLTRRDGADILKHLLHVQPWWILPFAGATLLAACVLRFLGAKTGTRPDTTFAVTGSAFSTGLSTMVLQVGLLFSFQNIYGFIYELVGLIVAMFMLGLALGAFISHGLGPRRTTLGTLLMVQGIMALLAGLMGAALPLAAAVQPPWLIFALFSALTFSAGLINGVNFPLAAGCFMKLCRRPEHSAGRIYGAELFGACLGAVLASALIAPVLGIVACCLLAATANATAFAVLWISRREEPSG